MARRIACYVIFIALIWGATAEREENIRNLFKSNMTRGDFSNLLKSLIRLNEQRVNVLQKLSRLEDYSMLSEVLRSGDKKGDGNLSNLFLVVLSKSALDGKNIFRNHRTSVDDDDIRVANDRNEQKLADDNRSERLGLLILDYNDGVLTRKRMNDNDNRRRAGKKKKKGRTDKKHIARQVESDAEEEEEVVKKKVKTPRVPDSEEREEEEEVEKKVKSERATDSEEREKDEVIEKKVMQLNSEERENEEVVEKKVKPLDSEERENEEIVEKKVKPLDSEETENEEGVQKKVKQLDSEEGENEEGVEKKVKPLNTEERENEEVVENKVKQLNSEDRENKEVVKKKLKPLRVPDSEERDDGGDMKSVATQCITEVEKKKVECTKACFWTYEDVCERLSCSMRAKKLFRRECEYNCRKNFDHSSCF